MTTNPEKFSARHAAICRRAEADFTRRRAQHPHTHTLEDEVAGLADAVRFFIDRRSSLAEVTAIAAAHLGIKLAGHAMAEAPF